MNEIKLSVLTIIIAFILGFIVAKAVKVVATVPANPCNTCLQQCVDVCK